MRCAAIAFPIRYPFPRVWGYMILYYAYNKEPPKPYSDIEVAVLSACSGPFDMWLLSVVDGTSGSGIKERMPADSFEYRWNCPRQGMACDAARERESSRVVSSVRSACDSWLPSIVEPYVSSISRPRTRARVVLEARFSRKTQ